MTNDYPRAGKIRSVFARVAARELTPDNFGSCLLTAVKEGFCTIDELTSLMNVEPKRIRQTANSMKPREISSIASALINRGLG